MTLSIVRGAAAAWAIGALGVVLVAAVAMASPAVAEPGRTARRVIALASAPGELVNELLGAPLSPTVRVMVRPPRAGMTGCELRGSRWWTWWLFGWALVPCGLVGACVGYANARRRRGPQR